MSEKKPTPAEVEADEKMIADMRRFGRPSPKAQAEARRLEQGKNAGGKK